MAEYTIQEQLIIDKLKKDGKTTAVELAKIIEDKLDISYGNEKDDKQRAIRLLINEPNCLVDKLRENNEDFLIIGWSGYEIVYKSDCNSVAKVDHSTRSKIQAADIQKVRQNKIREFFGLDAAGVDVRG